MLRAGRCRLPNSYLYDKEIIPRVQLYIREDGRFADSSIWVLGARPIVTWWAVCRQGSSPSSWSAPWVLWMT
ncbi:hypothetical protein BH11PSE7_BH11PSE7_19550 [soil metagenome]